MKAYLWLLTSISFLGASQIFSKLWVARQKPLWLLPTLATYMLGCVFWLPALRAKNQLAVMGTTGSLMLILLSVFLGTAFFGEHLSPTNWVGVALAFAAIALLA